MCCLCLKKDIECEPHHIEFVGMGRDRKKELKEHYSSVPVCRVCHQEYHHLGTKQYCRKYNLDRYELVFHYLSNYLPHIGNKWADRK